MIRLDARFKLCETIEDLNICRYIELQAYQRIEKYTGVDCFALLIKRKGENPKNTDRNYLLENIEALKLKNYFGYAPDFEVDKFLTTAKKSLGVLFPTDFQDNEFVVDLLRQYFVLRLKAHTFDHWHDEKTFEELERVASDLKSEMEENQKTTILDIYRGFEAICYFVSQGDGIISVKELKELSVYEFYQYKENVMEKIKQQKKTIKHG